MESSILKQAARFLREQKKNKQWQKVMLCLGVIVAAGTVTALMMPGQALNHTKKVLDCHYKAHEHTQGCYDESGKLICGMADYAIHVHNGDCYDEAGILVCPLPEIEKHEHTEECYDEAGNLICDQLIVEEHVHGPECFRTVELTEEEVANLNGTEVSSSENDLPKGVSNGNDAGTEDVSGGDVSGGDVSGGDLLVYCCGLEEHTHEEACYDAEGNLICGLEEHVHTEECLEVPVVTMTAEGTDYVITMTAPVTSLPVEAEDITLQVRELTEEDEDYAIAIEVMEDQLENESYNHRVFDISLIYNGYEIEPIGSVNVTFTPKVQPEETDEELSATKIYHVDTENNVVDDMEATMEEDGTLSMETDHFSIFSLDEEVEKRETEGSGEETSENSEEGQEPAEVSDGNIDVSGGDADVSGGDVVPVANNRRTYIILADSNWGSIKSQEELADAIEAANRGELSQYKLVKDFAVEGENAWYWIKSSFTLDLNGHTITYTPNKSNATANDVFLFSVGTNVGDSGTLTILDSTGTPSKEEVEDVTGTLLPYGNVAEYDDASKILTYYVTKSEANGDKVGTTESLWKHTVDLNGVGAIEGKGEEILQLIRIVKGTFNLEGGRLTNGMYGHAIKTASTDATKANDYTINISGGYIVGNTVWGEGDGNQLYKSTGGNSETSGWGGPYGAGIMLNYGTGTNALNITGGVIAANQSKYGGGLYVEAACSVSLGGNAVIAGNEAGISVDQEQGISGGGMYLNPKGQSCEISGNCYITNNVSWDEYKPEEEGNEVYGTYGGGGIYAGNPNSTIVVSGGYITGNSASAGGGIFLGNKSEWGIANSSLKITGGYIASNQARDGEGGGVRIPSTDSCLIEASGEGIIYITNNRTDLRQNWGGGGVYVAGGGTLKIINPLIINNTARGFGGGITGCSAGHVYLADGITSEGVAAIFDNIAKADNFAGDYSSKHEDRQAFQNDIFRQSGYKDVFCAMTSSFSNTMLGGGKENWQGSKNYEQLTDADRSGSSVSASVILGMSADPTPEDEEKAKDFVRNHGGVVISGNYSNIHGGGILCNGIMTIGDVNHMDLAGGLKIEFYKKYTDEKGNSQDLAAGQFEFALISPTKMREKMKAQGKELGDYYNQGHCIDSSKLIRKADGRIYYDDVDVTDAVLHTTTNLTDGSAVFSLDLAAVSNSSKDNNYNNDEYHYYLMEITDDTEGVTLWSTEAYEIWVTVQTTDATRKVLDKGITVKYYYVQKVEVQYYTNGTKHDDYKAVQGDGEQYYFDDDWLQGEYLGTRGLLEDWSHPAKVTLSYLTGDYKNNSFTNKGTKSYAFVIRKIDSETEEVMSGVGFTLERLDEDGKVVDGKVQERETVSGYADFLVLPNTNYLLKEKVPEGYEKAGPWWIEVDDGGVVTLYDAVKTEEGWEKGSLSEIKREKSEIASEKEVYKFYYQIMNTPEEAYTLPETGGPGTTLYTMAGICVLLTAGLLYKIKFRERRLKASRN